MTHPLFNNEDMLREIGFPIVNRITRKIGEYAIKENEKLVKIFNEELQELHDQCPNLYSDEDSDEDSNKVYSDYMTYMYTPPSDFFKLRIEYKPSHRIYWKNKSNYNEIRFGNLLIHSRSKDISPLLASIEYKVHVSGTLNLSNNHISTLSANFIDKFTVGKNLNLRNCRITRLPNMFHEMQISGDLKLDFNLLRRLPKNFGAINVGGSLFLNDNLLEKIPLSFSIGSVGDSLYLNSNKIISIDKSFRNYNFKNTVDLSWNVGELRYFKIFRKYTRINELKKTYKIINELLEWFKKK
jgi:hypothetical protein